MKAAKADKCPLFEREVAAMPLSVLFKPRWKRSDQTVAKASDRRGDKRYPAYQPVTIRLHGMPPVAGTLVSISLGGAAIRFHGWVADVPEPWLTRLKRGDELRVDGLNGGPMCCRAVTAADGVLRVQFSRDDALRHKLRSVVDDAIGPLAKPRKVDGTPSGRLMPGSMADRSPAQLRAHAAKYRVMARTTVSAATVTSLLRLADRFDALAKQREDVRDSVT
jgi:hypothetical protein